MDTGQRRPACIHHPFLSLGTKLWRHDPRQRLICRLHPHPFHPIHLIHLTIYYIYPLSSLSILFPARSAGPYTYTYTLPYSGLGHEADPPLSFFSSLFRYGREAGRGGEDRFKYNKNLYNGSCIVLYLNAWISSRWTLWNEYLIYPRR